MHADIAIAPRLHNIIAAIRAIRAMHIRSYSRAAISQIGRKSSSADARRPTQHLLNTSSTLVDLLRLGQPPRTLLASTAQESQAMEPFRRLTHWRQVDGVGQRAIARCQRQRRGRMLYGQASDGSDGHAGLDRYPPRQAS